MGNLPDANKRVKLSKEKKRDIFFQQLKKG